MIYNFLIDVFSQEHTCLDRAQDAKQFVVYTAHAQTYVA